MLALILVVDGRHHSSTNEIQGDKEEAPVSEEKKHSGTWVRRNAPGDKACAQCSDDEAIQQNNQDAKPLKREEVVIKNNTLTHTFSAPWHVRAWTDAPSFAVDFHYYVFVVTSITHVQ